MLQAEDPIKLVGQYDYSDLILSVQFRENSTPSPVWLVQYSNRIDVLNGDGRIETSIMSQPNDVVISSPDQRYFAKVNIGDDQTSAISSSILAVQVFHFTGETIYTYVWPFNRVLSRPQVILNNRGSVVVADMYGTVVREIYAGTTLHEIDLGKSVPGWSAEKGSYFARLTGERGYMVASTIADSLTQIPIIQVAWLSNRLNLLTHYNFRGDILKIFENSGQGHVFLGYQTDIEKRTALLGRDSLISSASGVPGVIKGMADESRAFLIFQNELKIMNWYDGMLESGYTAQQLGKMVDAEFLPEIESYFVLFGQQLLMDEKLKYQQVNFAVYDKVGNALYTAEIPGVMSLKPVIHRISTGLIALKLDKQILLYAVPDALNK